MKESIKKFLTRMFVEIVNDNILSGKKITAWGTSLLI